MEALKKMGIGTKLMIFIIVVVVLTITIIASGALFQISSFNNKISQEQAVKGMEGLNSLIESYREQSLKFATIISLNNDVVDGVKKKDEKGINNVINSIANKSNLDFITITDSAGIVLASTYEGNTKGNNLASETNIQRAIKGSSFSTVDSGIIDKLTASAGVPIKDETNKIIGVISTGFMLDKVEMMDRLKEVYKTDITLFWGDVRFNTTIIQNGNRLIGTKLDPTIAEKVLTKKEKYIGDAQILGVPYKCAYMPLVNSDNQVIGVLFSGQSISEVISTRNKIINFIVGISGVAVLIFALSIYLYIKRKITLPLINVVSATEKIADRNMDVSINYNSHDEIGDLCNNFNKMTQNLNEVLSNIASSSKEVAASSAQMSASSIALSQGATEQASAIQELTATLDEVSQQTKQNANNSNQANEIAEDTKTKAINGNQQMKEMLDSIEEINNSSSDISKIIKVIDEIAFQTNILALNAAVEAARAGQHGKGFAVVAEEVRILAMRSANAAKETTHLIENSIRKAEDGAKIANKTAEELDSIVNGVTKVASYIKEIANASNEQATGIEQVNQAIYQISQVVQKTSDTSQESASASEELSSQAKVLKEQVGKFVLKRNDSSNIIDSIDPNILKTLDMISDKKKFENSDRGFNKN